MYPRECYFKLLEELSFEAIHAILENPTFVVSNKSAYDRLTNTDLTLHQYLSNFLKDRFPSSEILSEEDATTFSYEGAQDLWILDPLDGSHNFLYQIPLYGIQFCHIFNGKIQFSFIYLPTLKEVYVALLGEGLCYKLNERFTLIASASTSPSLPQQASYSFGDFSNSNPDSRAFQALVMARCAPCINKMRIHGSSSVDFAFLCSGRSQLHILFTRRPWELTPGLYLAESFGLESSNLTIRHSCYSGTMHLIGTSGELQYATKLIHDLLAE